MHAHCSPVTPRARRWFTGALVISSLVFATAGVNAADTPAAKPADDVAEPAFDPQAETALRAMSEFLRHQPIIELNCERILEGVTMDDEKIQVITQVAVQLQRPGKFKAELKMANGSTTWCGVDGRIVSVCEPDHRTSEITGLPVTIDGMLDAASERYHLSLVLADLVASDPMASFKQGTLSGRYLGQATIDGVPCLHLAYRAKNLDWQLWIEAGKTPLPRRLVITYNGQSMAPQQTLANLRWSFPTTLPADTFILAPPAGATVMEMKEFLSYLRTRVMP
jgi:hypothetical protein